MTVRCYAQRLLNPFRGVLNIIEYESAEAVSMDGVHWDIYVRDADLVNDIESDTRIQTSDIRYGHWSNATGLKRGPIYPSADFKRLEDLGAFVYEYLLHHHHQVPFPLQDHYELWLLDENSQPLVLIDSVYRLQDLDLDRPADWRAGLACRDTFRSRHADTGNSAEYLGQYLRQHCTDRASAQIFHRQPDGRGHGLHGIHLDPGLQQRVLPENAFPRLLIRRDQHDQQHQALIEDYLDWLAPWLLLLPCLSQEERSHYEQQSRKQALEVEKQYRLYPEIIDDSLIKASLVEAQLRRSQPVVEDPDDVVSTFYIELNPGPTD